MKLKQLTIYIFLIALATNAIAQKDSITIGKKKQYFVGVGAGLGLGWRINENIPDSAVFSRINSVGENPGLAYTFSLNGGFTNKRFCMSIGIEYNFAEYHNNSYPFYIDNKSTTQPNDSMLVTIKYRYSHKLVSIPLHFNFFLGKKLNWVGGIILESSWLVDYERNKSNLKKSYPVFMFGAEFGRKILDTQKLDLIINCQFYHSSIIGNDVFVSEVYYQSKPHRLIVPSIGINLNYKL